MKTPRKASKKSKAPSKAADGGSGQKHPVHELLQKWNEEACEDQSRWLSKPRLHTAIFDEYRKSTLTAHIDDAASPSPDHAKAFHQRRTAMTEEIERIKSLVGGEENFQRLLELVFNFRKKPSIEQYALIRKDFPEIDIQVSLSGGIDPLFAIEKKLEGYGIPPSLVAGAMDGFEPDIDRLCLILIDRLVERSKIKGAGAMQLRRKAMSDAMVNYLIAFMLEGADWADAEIRMPASLILLIRHQLGALTGDFHEDFKSREGKLMVAWFAGQQLDGKEKLSINRLVKLIAQIRDFTASRSTCAKWLKDSEFQRHFESSRQHKISPEKFSLKNAAGSLAKNNVRDTP